jgi:hypothetical protein
MVQLELFAGHSPAQAVVATDPERVRRKLDLLLAEACGAGANGLPQAQRRLMESIVPQMTRWLPEDEAEEVRRAFGEALAS